MVKHPHLVISSDLVRRTRFNLVVSFIGRRDETPRFDPPKTDRFVSP